jgi:hypothetical protein
VTRGLSRTPASPGAATEQRATLRLAAGDIAYTLRRAPAARRLRLTVHPDRGLVVTIPPASRRGWARPDDTVERFIGEREAWIRRHLERQRELRARLDARPPLDAGRVISYLGIPHRVRVVDAPSEVRVTRVSRVGADDGDELLVERSSRDERPAGRILDAWFRRRARSALDLAIDRFAPGLGVTPGRITIRDTTSRWGSCSRTGGLSFSWRLILAPPEALEAVAVHELCHLRVFGHGPRFHALLDATVPDNATWRRWLRRHAPELHAALD